MRKLLLLSVLLLLAGCIRAENNAGNQQMQNIVLKKIVPSSDVPGKEPSWLPRPSGFVRTYYSEQENEFTIEYRAKGNRFDEAVEHYKNLLKGWEKREESSEAGAEVEIAGISGGVEKSLRLEYARENEDSDEYLTLDIKLVKLMGQEFTEVSIGYIKYPKESEEESYKPIDAEPYVKEVPVPEGAVLYDRNYVMMGNMKVYTDKYYIKKSLEDVFSFYSGASIEGYTKYSENMDESGASISFMKESGEILTVNLQKAEEGTLIEISKMSQAG